MDPSFVKIKGSSFLLCLFRKEGRNEERKEGGREKGRGRRGCHNLISYVGTELFASSGFPRSLKSYFQLKQTTWLLTSEKWGREQGKCHIYFPRETWISICLPQVGQEHTKEIMSLGATFMKRWVYWSYWQEHGQLIIKHGLYHQRSGVYVTTPIILSNHYLYILQEG